MTLKEVIEALDDARYEVESIENQLERMGHYSSDRYETERKLLEATRKRLKLQRLKEELEWTR